MTAVPRLNRELTAALDVEILKSECLRARILATIFSVMFVVLCVGSVVASDMLDGIFHNKFPYLGALGGIAFFVVYEWLSFFDNTRRAKERRPPTETARLFNTFCETSIPSLVVMMVMGVFHPVYAILAPPTFMYFLFIALSALRLDMRVSVFTGVVAAVEYCALATYALSQPRPQDMEPMLTAVPHHLGKAMLFLVTGAVTGLVAHQIRARLQASLEQVEEKNRVVNLFGQHVSPSVVNKLLSQETALVSENRHVAVMFLDIRNFTTFSESRRPEDVIAYLNELFGFMIEIINRHNGIINKFLGDGFMAVFGAPFSDGKNSRSAVEAAEAILLELDVRIRAGKLPPTKVGIGIHCGEAVTGNVGSEERKEYTIIGDVVNLASRIESLNKQMNSHLLISAQVRTEAGDLALRAESMGDTPVKGRAEPVGVYKLA